MTDLFDRRELLLGFAALATPGGLTAQASPGQQLVTTPPPTPPGATPARAAVPHPKVIRQACPVWCWAASTAMIFANNGHPVDQQTIVERVFNMRVCRKGGGDELVALLNDDWTDTNGKRFRAQIHGLYNKANAKHDLPSGRIVAELEAGRPLLYANPTHAMVLVAVDYFRMPDGKQPRIWRAIVADPWPQSPEIHPLKRAAFIPDFIPGGQARFLAAVTTTPL